MTELVKSVVPSRGRAWLSQGLGWVAGYVVRRQDVTGATTPAALHADLGLGFPGSPVAADAPHLDVLRIPAAPYAILDTPGSGAPETGFADHSPFSGTGFVESAGGFVPYWWMAPAALPAGTTLWRVHADGREELIAAYSHVAVGWLSARPGIALPAVPPRAPELIGIWADSGGERLLADVLPDGTVILCAPEEREGMQLSARGVWWREATHAEVERVYAVRIRGTWRGRPVQVVGAERGSSDVVHIVYVGHDAFAAEALGLTKSDAGVYEAAVPAGEVDDLREEQVEIPLVASGTGGCLVTTGGSRDPRADRAYFDDVVAHLDAFIATDDERLRRPDDQWRKPAALGVAAGDAMKNQWSRFSSRYSQGADLQELRASFDQVLAAAERALELEKRTLPPATIAVRFRMGGNRDFYREWLWLVSIALALGVDDDVFDRVVAAVEFGWGDRLLDRLIASRHPEHPVGKRSGFPLIVQPLDDAFDADDAGKAAEFIGLYLSGWYASWKDVWGWGGHEFLDKKYYWGYWAFEAIGVVAALNLDDASFRDDEHYPRDLAPAP